MGGRGKVKYYKLTKNQIKAIRILKGYSPNLRIQVKVPYDQIQYDKKRMGRFRICKKAGDK